MKFKIFLLYLGLLSAFFITIPASAQQDLLRVALSKNAPLVFTDENGGASGFYVDIIEYIAEQEGWTLQFVPCTWQECQDFLADGSIDLLMSVAYTEERAQKFDFTSEFVFNNWAYIYRKPGSQIESVLDLEGKKVAAVSGNILTAEFREMLQSFDIESEVVEVDDYPDMFRLLDVGVVDAGVANRVNGLKYESQFDVEKTSIIFHPIELLFATPKGKHSEIREAIDRHMVELKADKDSLYYQSLNNWLGIEQVAVFPDWVKWSLGFGIGALGLLLIFIFTLRSQVSRRTAELRRERASLEQKVQERTLELAGSVEQLEGEVKERIQLEDALRESEARYRSITDDVIDTLMIGIFILDNDFRVVWVNQAIERFFGIRRDEIIGLDKRRLIRERVKHIFEHPDGFEQTVVATYDDNTYVENFVCHLLPHHERKERWLEHWSQPIQSGLYAGGRIEHYSDITERVRAEGALRESEERYRELVNVQSDQIFRELPDGTVSFVNDAACHFFGISREDFIGTKMDRDAYVHPGDKKGVVEMMNIIGPENPLVIHKNRNVDASGEIHWFEWLNQAIFDDEGNLAEIQYVGRDITERVQVEQALQKYTHDLGERVKELSCLYGIFTLVDKSGVSLEEIIQGTVDLIPPAWQYPEITCARISFEGKEYRTRDFRKTSWMQSSGIMVYGDTVGLVDVCYLEERPGSDEGPFLKEERALIDAIVGQLGNVIERMRAEQALRESEERYRTFIQNFQGIAYRGDMDFKPIFFHGAVESLTGYTEDEFITGEPRWD